MCDKLWDETPVPNKNPHRQGESMKKEQKDPKWDSNPRSLSDSANQYTIMIFIRCITDDKLSSNGNNLPREQTREQSTVSSCASVNQCLKTHSKQTVSWQDTLRLSCAYLQTYTKPSVTRASVTTLQSTSVLSYCSSQLLPDGQVHKFTPCSVPVYTSAYMWPQGFVVPTSRSLQQSAERGEG